MKIKTVDIAGAYGLISTYLSGYLHYVYKTLGDIVN
jgi:hypothetical protein